MRDSGNCDRFIATKLRIVTEYTSFLVLENDAEYQRWKIERRNLDRVGRDRAAQTQLRAQLDSIRNKAIENLGPKTAGATPTSKPMQLASTTPTTTQTASIPTTQTQTTPTSSRQSWDFKLPGTGSSPVGPLGALGAAWLLRRKRKSAQ